MKTRNYIFITAPILRKVFYLLHVTLDVYTSLLIYIYLIMQTSFLLTGQSR